LISLDGASTLTLHELYRQGVLHEGGFERFFRDGEVADELIPVDPTLTSTNHISLATGFWPASTGIVGNQFHPSGSAFEKKVSGFDAPIETETLWEAARRQGLRTAVLAWPGADAKEVRRTADWGLVYDTAAERESQILFYSPADWHPPPPGSDHETVASYSALLAARDALNDEAGEVAEVFELIAVDRRDDGQINYDSVVVTAQPSGAERRTTAPLHVGEWAHLTWSRPGGRVSSWLKLLAFTPDLSRCQLFIGGRFHTIAYPDDFAGALMDRGLDWPGSPSSVSLAASWQGKPGIDSATWTEQAERMAAFLGGALRIATSRGDWDLLMGYIPVIDDAGHRLLLVDSRQPGFSPERRDDLERARNRVWQAVDGELRQLLAGLDLTTTTVVVVSDHGMTPVHTAVDPNAPLAELGLLAKDDKAMVGGSAPGPTAYAIGEGGAAHIYLDAGPEGSGKVKAAARILADLTKRYADWRVGGEAPIEKIFSRREAARIGLDHPNSGDLILFAREGFVFRNLPGGQPSAPAPVYGAHGHLSIHPDIQGIYMAIGAGIRPGLGGTVHATEIASRVAAWLGIAPPGHLTEASGEPP